MRLNQATGLCCTNGSEPIIMFVVLVALSFSKLFDWYSVQDLQQSVHERPSAQGG